VFVIDLNERPDSWLNTLYIRSDNYSIIRMEESYDSERDEERSWVVEGNPLIRAFPKFRILQVNFKSYEGKFYPENYRMTFRAIYKDSMTDKQVLDFRIDHYFVVTNINTGQLKEIHDGDILDRDVSLKNISSNDDPSFWSNYTILEETPIDSLTRIQLEQQMRLRSDTLK
jgi:hypothetical protein